MKLNILFLCNRPESSQDASTICDHIDSYQKYSAHNIWIHSGVGKIPDSLDLDLFDVIVIHYSIYIPWDNYLDSNSKNRIKDFNGLKVIFIQDEYRRINLMINTLNFLEIDVLFSCFPDNQLNLVYPKEKLPNISIYSNLTGYVPENLLVTKTSKLISERPIDVGYRARKIPYVLGRLAHEKSSIVDDWHSYSKKNNINLKTDLSYDENKRIYGNNWIEFLTSCKTTLGVESGASVMDFSGNLEIEVNNYLQKYPEASFEEVHDLFLGQYENKYYLNQISPRCFEAIALRTGLVLFEGRYSGILEPWRHFIPLKKDFSNFLKVIKLIQDNNYIQNMVDLTYKEIGCDDKYSYRVFIENFDLIIKKEFLERNKNESRKKTYINLKNIFEDIDIKIQNKNIVEDIGTKSPKKYISNLIQLNFTKYKKLIRSIKSWN